MNYWDTQSPSPELWRVYVANLVRRRILARQKDNLSEAERLRVILKEDYGVLIEDVHDNPMKTNWRLIPRN